MPHTPAAQDYPRLSLTWRRRFVRLLTLAAAGILITRSLAGIPPLVRYAGGALCLVLAVAALWFLLDSIRPWLAREGDADAATLRVLAGSRAHPGLVWLAAGGWLYMWAAEVSRFPLPTVQLDLSELLVGLFLTGLFLPVAVVAWVEPEHGRAVGPIALAQARFRGGLAVGHWFVAGLVGLCIALIVFAASPLHTNSAFGRVFMLTAVGLLIAAAFGVLALLIQNERSQKGDVGH